MSVVEARFDNKAAQTALAAFSVLIAVIGLATMFDVASRISGGVFFVLGVLFTVRSLKSSSVWVDASAVSTRSIVRTRRYAFSEILGADVAVGRTGLAAFDREHLLIRLIDGREIAFKELNCRVPRDSSTSIVRSAAACINSRLEAR